MNAYAAASFSLGCLLLTAVLAFFNAVFGSTGIGAEMTVATDKSGGLNCRNYLEFERLLDLVIPLR